MDLWLKFTNVVTVGNMSAVSILICAGIFFYYKIRRYLAQQHAEFLIYLNSLTEAQTTRLEECIHKLPEHPENPATNGGTSTKVP